MKTQTQLLKIILITAFSALFHFAKAQRMVPGELQETNTIVSCNCSKPGYGCFATDWACKMACAIYCHHVTSASSLVGVFSDSVSNSMVIAFSLQQSGYATVKIFDASGNLIKVLNSEELDSGDHELSWNRRDENGNEVDDGIYALSMQTQGSFETQKFSVMK